MARKRLKKIGVTGKRTILQAVGANSVLKYPYNNRNAKEAFRRISRHRLGSEPLSNALFVSLLCLAGFALAGCSSPKPSLGAISVTDPTGTQGGQLTSVVIDSTADVSVSVGRASVNLGVDWNLTCGGSPTSLETTNVCGSLNPVHVGSNINMIYTAPAYVPVGNTVTLTATVTSDPSVFSTVTLTILPQPITIAFSTIYPPPSQGCPTGTYCLGESGMAQIAATVTNDPIAAGVNWTVTCTGGT